MNDKAPGWKKGQSGNPRGRPKGSRNKATLLAIAAMEGELTDVVKVVIDAAKGGDMAAARLVVDKLIPTTRERPLSIALPDVTSVDDCATAQAKVLAAVAAGEILPGEGETLAGLIEHQRRSLETSDLAARMTALEEQLKERGRA
ncbi:DUF5681 domain-containing protein [Azovibrio restrictus]|uniref:DUF5681 domain-containing protein n=1 Tax=Azovibrio restrictus TaxID=146938 RepID=UPI0026EF06E9|nr:DUF5681 domain-containing protein [Azovibrio restrictus]MDD3481821.1 DUF5681 domain-containing protein [Azovibrio restrictus]